jgi:hypothetical protein
VVREVSPLAKSRKNSSSGRDGGDILRWREHRVDVVAPVSCTRQAFYTRTRERPGQSLDTLDQLTARHIAEARVPTAA